MVGAAQDFVRDHRLTPVAAEQVIVAPAVGLGTRFDLLCSQQVSQQQQQRHTLISWKTTGNCPFDADTNLVALEKWVVQQPDVVERQCSSQVIVAREHLAQLALELYMLRETHRVSSVTDACIVYLAPSQRTYRVIWLDRESLEPAGGYMRVWQYITGTMRL
jgi:hypothetical protein